MPLGCRETQRLDLAGCTSMVHQAVRLGDARTSPETFANEPRWVVVFGPWYRTSGCLPPPEATIRNLPGTILPLASMRSEGSPPALAWLIAWMRASFLATRFTMAADFCASSFSGPVPWT